MVSEVSPHRLELCTSCGTVRVKFENWWYMYPDMARQMLEQVEVERDRYVGPVPDELSRALHAPKRRLGRSLLDIQRVQGTMGEATILKLFPKPKP